MKDVKCFKCGKKLKNPKQYVMQRSEIVPACKKCFELPITENTW